MYISIGLPLETRIFRLTRRPLSLAPSHLTLELPRYIKMLVPLGRIARRLPRDIPKMHLRLDIEECLYNVGISLFAGIMERRVLLLVLSVHAGPRFEEKILDDADEIQLGRDMKRCLPRAVGSSQVVVINPPREFPDCSAAAQLAGLPKSCQAFCSFRLEVFSAKARNQLPHHFTVIHDASQVKYCIPPFVLGAYVVNVETVQKFCHDISAAGPDSKPERRLSSVVLKIGGSWVHDSK
ncbi:hypothetical protein ARSEF4850_000560 [Beauveria asiatica]